MSTSRQTTPIRAPHCNVQGANFCPGWCNADLRSCSLYIFMSWWWQIRPSSLHFSWEFINHPTRRLMRLTGARSGIWLNVDKIHKKILHLWINNPKPRTVYYIMVEEADYCQGRCKSPPWWEIHLTTLAAWQIQPSSLRLCISRTTLPGNQCQIQYSLRSLLWMMPVDLCWKIWPNFHNQFNHYIC